MALTVNGELIDENEIQQEFERLKPRYDQMFSDQSEEERKTQLTEWSKENIIERILLKQEAIKRAEVIPQKKIETVFADMKKTMQQQGQKIEEIMGGDLQRIKSDIELHLRIDKLISDITADSARPSDEQIAEYYAENKEQFTTPEQIRVSHIVKHPDWKNDQAAIEKIMAEAKRELENGAVFEMLAQKYSDCPDKGGDLGYIARGQMVEEFEDVVFNMDVGQVSDIFHTRYGLHIAKVNDRKPAAPHSLEEVKSSIEKYLQQEIQNKKVEEFVDMLKSVAEIKRD